MTGFNERVHLKGKAEEDQYFAKLDRGRIAALHAKNTHAQDIETSSEKLSPDARRRVPDGPDKIANHPTATAS
jgi:hypothetical protein